MQDGDVMVANEEPYLEGDVLWRVDCLIQPPWQSRKLRVVRWFATEGRAVEYAEKRKSEGAVKITQYRKVQDG